MKIEDVSDKTIENLVAIFRQSAAEKDKELHKPSKEFPGGFYCKEDRDIIAEHAMKAALTAFFERENGQQGTNNYG